MEKTLSNPLSEIIFSSSDSAISQSISRQVKSKKLRKIAPKVYTSNFVESADVIIRRNLYPILSHLYPNALLSHRTALEGRPTKTGTVFLTYKYTKKITLPGITVCLTRGPGAINSDLNFLNTLFMSSRARAFLENLQPSKNRGAENKTVSKLEIEEFLDEHCRIHGEKDLNQLRDQARTIAKKLKMRKEFSVLNQIIGAILQTNPQKNLRSAIAKARRSGNPYDPQRMLKFETLFSHLHKNSEPIKRPQQDKTSWKNAAFFEAYFSNFIEGTQFEIDEAREIILEGKLNPNRPADTHDILGTYQIVGNLKEMKKVPTRAEDLIELLKTRHATLLSGRPEMNPGRFKEKPNRAGNSEFVQPDLVKGTLVKGFEFYQALRPGWARSVFMMFLVSEVHPFADGNGRIARIMMNAELVCTGLCKIIIPTILREDYLLSLRALTRNMRPVPLIRLLDKAQDFTSKIDFKDYKIALKAIQNSNAFMESAQARLIL